MIPERVINEIRDRTDIVQIIGSVLDLKRAGRNFKALCPFHGEKTPSFMVSPDKQIYHCFGCGKGGNAFNFIMDYEGVGFVEAVRKLAVDAGVDIERYLSGGEARERLEPYYRAVEFADQFYRDMLRKGEGSDRARAYLVDRGIDEELIDYYHIGYAPPGWDNLHRAAAGSGISIEILLELNLVLRSRGGSGYRDYFRNRIIFPISTISNRTVGLAGRVLDSSEPKYLNTTESSIYSKGRILYGLNGSKDEIRKVGSAILVEGYMDYLMLWKKEIRNICAVCGTALTEDQARLLARYANRVYIINDGDRAGMRAAVRASDQLIVQGLETRIVVLPEGEDPDSYVVKEGADALRDLMRSAPDYFTYLREEAERGNRKTYRRNQVIQHLLGTISRVDDGVKRDLYMQELSQLFGVPVQTLRSGLKKPSVQRESEEKTPAGESRRQKYQKMLFRLGLEGDRFATEIVEKLDEEDIEGVHFRNIYKAMGNALRSEIDVARADTLAAEGDSEFAQLFSEIALMDPPPGPPEEFIEDTIVWLKKMSLRDELGLLKKRLGELKTQSNGRADDEEMEIAEAYRKISRELKKMGFKEEKRIDGSRQD
jgi:DNA primase